MSELIATVHLQDENGITQTFEPGDDVPSWAQALITNPKAWLGGEVMKSARISAKDIPVASETVAKLVEPAKRGPGRPAKASKPESTEE